MPASPEERNRQRALELYEAQSRRDNETMFAIYAPDIEWDMSTYPHWLERSLYHGHEGVRGFMRDWLASFDTWEPHVEDALAAGDEVLLVICDRIGFKDSDAVVERHYGHLLSFRDGRVVRSAIYHDLDEARARLRT